MIFEISENSREIEKTHIIDKLSDIQSNVVMHAFPDFCTVTFHIVPSQASLSYFVYLQWKYFYSLTIES